MIHIWIQKENGQTSLLRTSHYNLAKELKTSELFTAVKFNVLSASTASFELEDFVYIWM